MVICVAMGYIIYYYIPYLSEELCGVSRAAAVVDPRQSVHPTAVKLQRVTHTCNTYSSTAQLYTLYVYIILGPFVIVLITPQWKELWS